MTIPRMTVLVVGATRSIGRLVVDEAIRQVQAVRALLRSQSKARQLPGDAQVVSETILSTAVLQPSSASSSQIVSGIGLNFRMSIASSQDLAQQTSHRFKMPITPSDSRRE
jgi:NAD(P)-dependent dehydrogenase (short-subunit alcohol dehydrogenase family)